MKTKWLLLAALVFTVNVMQAQERPVLETTEVEEDITPRTRTSTVAPPPPPPPPPPARNTEEIFRVVENMPRYYGAECDEKQSKQAKKECSMQEMLNFIYGNLKYPAIAKENKVDWHWLLPFSR